MKIGIITVLFNSNAVLHSFIRSLNNQEFIDFHTLFIANDNHDEYRKAMQSAAFPYTYIQNEQNKGVAYANNQGIDFFRDDSQIDFLLFLNNDVEFSCDFLLKHKYAVEQHHVDVVVPKILYFDTKRIWYAGGKLSYLKGGVYHFGHNKTDILNKREQYRVSYAPTCSFLINKKVLSECNVRMKEDLFVYYDDYKFCLDLKKKGVKLYYYPNITLFHKISTSTGGSQSAFSRYYLTRNRLYLLRKEKNIFFFLFPFELFMFLVTRKEIEMKAAIDSLKMK